jgi:hypothetical protein
MTPSSVDTSPTGHGLTAQKRVDYKYDVKLEIGERPGTNDINVVGIFRDLVKKMKSSVDVDKPLAVLTATDQMFFDEKEMSSEDFQKAFKVENIEGKTRKVILGFKLRSMTTLYEIKQKLLKNYLIPNGVFMKEHLGGFHEGLKTYSYGFLKLDHPDHPDRFSLSTRFSKHISEAWKKLDRAEKTKWKTEVPQAFYADGVAIPLTFSKERIVAEIEGKPKVVTNAIVVMTPRQYGTLLRLLLDKTIIGKKINNLIPFAYQKEDATGYYHLTAEHVRFMEQHRNIPIHNVPFDAPTHRGMKGDTLDNVLLGNKFIQRVSYDSTQKKYHISTQAPKYREVHDWITAVLKEHQFSYDPFIRPMKYGNSVSTTKYSSIFADAVSVANASYDASTIKTTRSNVWKQRPPLNISYDPSAEAFPPLPKTPNVVPPTPSTASETFEEDTIQSAISQAIKTLQEQHRREIDQLKTEMQNKMAEMENQMKELGQQIVAQTYQALSTDDSPLATKTDHIRLQNDMNVVTHQLTQLLQMVSQGMSAGGSPFSTQPTSPPRSGKRLKKNKTPEKLNYCEDMFTDDKTVTSADSDLDEGSERCEE